jgi:Rrf2 family protein
LTLKSRVTNLNTTKNVRFNGDAVRFTKDVEYALISLIAIGGSEDITSAREIAEEYTVPYDRLCKILQRLAGAEILESIKGAHGGYRMAATPEEITLGDVIDALQGKKRVTPCLDDVVCVRSDVCNIKGSVQGVQMLWEDMMGSLTLAEFAQKRERTPAS